jgi:ATP-binding cassette subfamily B protein
VVKNVQEGLGGIRDVILGQSFGAYLRHYRQHDWPLRQLTVRENLLNEFPAHAVTAGAFVAMAGLACLLVTTQGGLSEALPSLGLLAMGGQRMLPAVHLIYYSIGQIRGSEADLEGVLAMLEAPVDESLMVRHQPAPFAESIALDHVSFRYTADGPDVIRKMSLSIEKGSRVAIVGPSGSGKSTLADLLMGLLEPTSGHLLIDGQAVSTLAWQANIAHVPQVIFLADASLAENIALGIPREEVDRDRLEAAANAAQIGSFINSLPYRFETTVGERGIRLSGGQRQRIGIARALYKQAPVLVLDEATSALDDATERAVMETIEGLSRDLTIIMIAHRISTTAYCDRILTVDPTAPENGVKSSFSQTQQ